MRDFCINGIETFSNRQPAHSKENKKTLIFNVKSRNSRDSVQLWIADKNFQNSVKYGEVNAEGFGQIILSFSQFPPSQIGWMTHFFVTRGLQITLHMLDDNQIFINL